MRLPLVSAGNGARLTVSNLMVWDHGQPHFLSLAALVTRFEDAAVPGFVFGVNPAQPQPANRAMIAGGGLARFI
jgi:hypothetical protein